MQAFLLPGLNLGDSNQGIRKTLPKVDLKQLIINTGIIKQHFPD